VRLLIVKTSSMGDVVHALPALSDIVALRAGVEVDWLVEAPFAAIPALHPGVRRVLPLAWRKWRRSLCKRETRAAMGSFVRELRREPYDLVLDLQSLVKSALWARVARGPVAGFDRASAREPGAALFYDRRARVPRHDEIQAVERCRRLAAAHLGYPMPSSGPVFGIQAPEGAWQPPSPHAVLIPAASRVEKLWPEERWIAVGRWLHERGATPVVLWGGEAERQRAERIAHGCAGVVPPFLSVKDSAAVLGHATQVVGLDTGFTHLAAAFGRPTVGIYCDYEPGLAAITGDGPVASLGGKGVVPGLEAVLEAVQRQSSSMRSGG
jgi:heptosyltransferase-1